MENINDISRLPEVMKVAEAATFLRKGKVYVYNAVREGTIPAIHLGKSVRIVKSELEKWLQGQSSTKVSEMPCPNADTMKAI